MKKIFIHNAFFRLLIPPFYGVLVYLLILLINNDVSQINAIFTGQEVYVCIGLSYVLSEFLRLNILIHNKFFPDGISTYNRVLLQFVTGVFISVITISLAISAYFEYIVTFSISETQLIVFNAIFAISSIFYNLLYFSHIYMHKENVERIENERILTESVEGELAQFKNEVNPNLLYDSLENLITLIHKDTEEAEDYIDHLSAVYRYILSHRKVELASLEEEIKAANHIIHLLNYTFNHHIQLTVNVNTAFRASPLVPGSLPYLIEHIIRSSIINEFMPLNINLFIEKDDGYIVIESKLNDKLTKPTNDKQLFENIQRSYSYYTERPVVKVKAYDYNYFKIPLMELTEEIA